MSAEKADASSDEPPPLLWRAAHFAEAVAHYVASGCENVTPEEYMERLRICDACPLQRFGKCGICGCSLSIKAMMRSERCPRYDPLWPR